MISEKKLTANRLNAKKSTGPKTNEGKATSARNAQSHGLFCRDVVIAGESEEEFRELRQEFIKSLRPQDVVELALVDGIVIAQWKLRRLHAAEKASLEAEKTTPGEAMSRKIIWSKNSIEKFSRIEQRLNNEVHRCLRDLQKLRAENEKREELAESPYVDEAVETVIVKNEPTAECKLHGNMGFQPMLNAPHGLEARGTGEPLALDGVGCAPENSSR
jgi:hypothetical protein